MDPISRLAQARLQYGKTPVLLAILIVFFSVLIAGSALAAAVSWMFWPARVAGSWKGKCLGGTALVMLEQTGPQVTGTARLNGASYQLTGSAQSRGRLQLTGKPELTLDLHTDWGRLTGTVQSGKTQEAIVLEH